MINDTFCKSDMLSSKKIKLHGMSEPRWTTRDKITQYKGLINLYKRDKKISRTDKSVALKRDVNMVAALKKQIGNSRLQLDNAIFGDRQGIRNALGEKRRNLLAYKHLRSSEILEHISKTNFDYRKQLDLYNYRKMIKSRKLINAKLLRAELHDRLIYSAPGQLPIEIRCKIVTASVQDAFLKKEAAIVINDSYKKIISVCKKDSIYFDVILESLRDDRSKQGKCMLSAILLGQLATEYLYDRKNEYKVLERLVKADMRARRAELNELEESLNMSNKRLKFLIRKDSDLTLGVANPKSNLDIEEHISFISKKLDTLKESFATNSYFALNDCLRNQHHQFELLKRLAEKCLRGRDALQNKINHSSLIHDEMYNTMIATTFEYKNAKQSLKNQIQKKVEKINEVRQLYEKRSNKIVAIKMSLQHLEQRCKYIKEPFNAHKQKHKSIASEHAIAMEALDIKANCIHLLDILVPKLTLLSTSVTPIVDPWERDLAQMDTETLVLNRTKSTILEEIVAEESLIETDVTIEDATVPTRADIKANSVKIVADNTNKDDMDFIFITRSSCRKKIKY